MTGGADGDGGVGLFASSTTAPSTVDARELLIDVMPYSAAWFQGDVFVTPLDSVLSGGSGVELRPDLVLHGNGVFAADRAVAVLDGVQIANARIGVLAEDAAVELRGVTFAGDALDIQIQSCRVDEVPTTPEGATARVCPDEAVPTLRLAYDLGFSDLVGESE